VIQVDGLSMARGDRTIVHGVSFDVPRGTWLALVGTSGSGKTTILRALAGLEPIAAGRVSVGGCVHLPGPLPRGEERRAFHRAVGIVFQFHNLFAHLTALDNVCLAQVHALGRSRAAAERKARELLDGLGVTFYFGGTSLLIVVGVAMDTVNQIEAQLIMRHYEGFTPRAGRIRGRRSGT